MSVFAFREGYDIGGMGFKDVAHVDEATVHTSNIEGKEGEGHGVPRRGGRGQFRGGLRGGLRVGARGAWLRRGAAFSVSAIFI